jgi:hypothetical protein
MKLKLGSKAHRAHMSEVMKASWAKRRNKIAAREALRGFSELTNRVSPKSGGTVRISRPETNTPVAAVPVKRFVAFNYCPNCGEHLSLLYK